MMILLIMAAGIVIGFIFFPGKKLKIGEHLQFLCTFLLIFSMGVILGSRENFLDDLVSLGIDSFVLAVVPAVFSTIIVYYLTKKFMSGK